MSIELRTKSGEKIIELGGGACPRFRPNVDSRACYDAEGNQTVDFTADFNQPLPIQSEEWDAVYCCFALEHISYIKVPQFLAEVFRILKPGGKAVFIIPNTEAQVRWILEHPEGWDGKDFFNSASEKLFGTQDYPENSHKCYFTPHAVRGLFLAAGFDQIKTTPYGERQTDMVVEAIRPVRGIGSGNAAAVDERKGIASASSKQFSMRGEEEIKIIDTVTAPIAVPASIKASGTVTAPIAVPASIKASGAVASGSLEEAGLFPNRQSPEQIYTHKYFDCNGPLGPLGHWDHPWNEIAFRNVMTRKPESVLELGCGRGYLLKRFQSRGIPAGGLDVSKHAYMTRVTDPVVSWDVCKPQWPLIGPIQRTAGPGPMDATKSWDLCLSAAFLEHIPEHYLPTIIKEMARICKRGLHAIHFDADPNDPHRCTIKPKEWWLQQFKNHLPQGWSVEILSVQELHTGEFPQEVLNGDGKLKINIGSYTTMFHHGWENIDQHDLAGFASSFGFKFRQHDVRKGLPYPTGVVDLIYSSHFLEHLTYDEGLRFLRECRRVIRPGGMMRLIVPDAKLLMRQYCCTVTPASDTAGVLWTGEFDLDKFDEVNSGCASASTAAGKLHALLWGGDHKAIYDAETSCKMLNDAGFEHRVSAFRQGSQAVLRETLDVLPCLSLYVEAIAASPV